MPNRLFWYVGDRNPSITETITSGGTAVDVSASSVTFNMRAVGSSTLTVDDAATSWITDGTDGGVRYDWLAADVDTAGEYLVWWNVTTSSKIQAVHEAIIEIRAHAPTSQVYVELEQAKAAISLSGFNHADGDLARALASASRAVDDICGRRFYPDTDATSVRYFTAFDACSVFIDDLVTLTTLATDSTGDGVYESTWTASDYSLEPINAPSDSFPYTEIDRKPYGSYYFPVGVQNGVKVTGKYGWSAIPSQVESATLMLAGRYMKRVREAPFGVVGVDSMIRLARNDPDVLSLLSPLMRNPGRPIW
jgi:hypothetical protein